MINNSIKTLIKNSKFYQRRGTSLVGLLIGVALSIFLVTVLLQIFISNKVNNTIIQNLQEINSSIRIATQRIIAMGSYAGYIYSQNATSTLAYPDATFGTVLGCSGCAVIPINSGSSTDGLRDQVIFSFQGNGINFTDCSGNLATTAVGSATRTKFSLVSVAGKSGMSLRCDNVGTNGLPISSNTSTDLISDLVEGMWIRYGYDLTGSGSPQFYANDYNPITTNAPINPNSVNKTLNYPNIRSVRIALLLHSRDNIFATPKPQNFLLWGNNITRTSQLLYRLHVFTVPLSQIP